MGWPDWANIDVEKQPASTGVKIWLTGMLFPIVTSSSYGALVSVGCSIAGVALVSMAWQYDGNPKGLIKSAKEELNQFFNGEDTKNKTLEDHGIFVSEPPINGAMLKGTRLR